MATYREELEELRDLLLVRLKDCAPRDTAGIAKQYADTILKIEGFAASTPEEGRKSDDLSARRAARIANSSGT